MALTQRGGELDTETADAFRAWVRDSGIDWAREPGAGGQSVRGVAAAVGRNNTARQHVPGGSFATTERVGETNSPQSLSPNAKRGARLPESAYGHAVASARHDTAPNVFHVLDGGGQ